MKRITTILAAMALIAASTIPVLAATDTNPDRNLSRQENISAMQRLQLLAQNKTCNGEGGRPAAPGSTRCMLGQLHECNGRTGEWVNLRKKC